jgi:NAD-reducing hydrogenase large subunit
MLRIVDDAGALVSELPARDYASVIEEQSSAESYTKTLFLKGRGVREGAYRVGPLARINLAESVSTPLASAELAEFKALGAGRPVAPSLFYHYARMIELLYAVERASELLRFAEILSADVRVPVKRRAGEGVGVIEAPRGTLIHHYAAREDGRITKVNLVVATAHNKTAMNESVAQVAQSLVSGGTIEEGQLNFVEMAIRCYDPCLSCSTHAYGKMPLDVELRDATGATRARFRRGGG